MLANGVSDSTSDELEQRVEHEINRRTGRRVRHLGVRVTGNQIHVRGFCPSYYDKQLALHAILERFASMAVVLDIDVIASVTVVPQEDAMYAALS